MFWNDRAARLAAVSVFGLLALAAACSKKEPSVTPPSEVDSEITLTLKDGAKLGAEQAEILKLVGSRTRVSFELISNAWFRNHAEHYAQSTPPGDDADTYLKNGLVEKILLAMPDKNPHAMKIAYEKSLSDLATRPLVYNVDSISIVDGVMNASLQCYSGTVLHQMLVGRKLGGAKFLELHPVVIVESGHVLPGYLENKNGDWQLVGVETTASGEAAIDYGSVNAIKTPIRIVDARLFALIDVFKAQLARPVEIANRALQITAAKYGIKSIMKIENAWDYTKLNSTPFQFGEAKVPTGDQARVELKRVNRKDMAGQNPNAFDKGLIEVPRPMPTSALSEKLRDQLLSIAHYGKGFRVNPFDLKLCIKLSRLKNEGHDANLSKFVDDFCTPRRDAQEMTPETLLSGIWGIKPIAGGYSPTSKDAVVHKLNEDDLHGVGDLVAELMIAARSK